MRDNESESMEQNTCFIKKVKGETNNDKKSAEQPLTFIMVVVRPNH